MMTMLTMMASLPYCDQYETVVINVSVLRTGSLYTLFRRLGIKQSNWEVQIERRGVRPSYWSGARGVRLLKKV